MRPPRDHVARDARPIFDRPVGVRLDHWGVVGARNGNRDVLGVDPAVPVVDGNGINLRQLLANR